MTIQTKTTPPAGRGKDTLVFRTANEQQDIGEWSYDHRFGLCITLIVALVMAIIFVSAHIRFGGDTMPQAMVIDVMSLQELLEEERAKLEEAQKQNRELSEFDNSADYGKVRNVASNENAEIRDDKGTRISDLLNEAEKTQSSIDAGRKRYEQGLSENDRLLTGSAAGAGAGIGGTGGGRGSATNDPNGATGTTGSDSRNKSSHASAVKGSVTVSFSLTNPMRYERHLVTPAYMCEGGGTVMVRITVSRAGDVVSVAVDKASSTSDNCMTSAAVDAARQSKFNLDESAPDRQQGTITYIFIPQ